MKGLFWFIVSALSLLLVGICMEYWSFRSDVNFLLAKPDLVRYFPWRVLFYVHVAGASVALLSGLYQYVARETGLSLLSHRLMGKIYVVSILAIGGPSGFYMAFFAEGGLWASLGFVIMSVLWVYFSWSAWMKIRKGDVPGHKKQMTRSFAMTLSAVTLRLYVPVMSAMSFPDKEFIIISSAWVSWILNLMIAEIILSYKTSNSFNLKIK